MPTSVLVACDLLAITVLTFALYFPRHRRRDLVVSYLGVNVGVLAVAAALTFAEVTVGLGIGLFGVLSIIRLRSRELDQHEVAYYFVALALGILGAVKVEPAWLSPALMVSLLAALYVGDHPRLLGGYRVLTINLDAAYTTQATIAHRLDEMLDGSIHRVRIRRVDLVNDTTLVEVRYQTAAPTDDVDRARPRDATTARVRR